MTISRDSQNWLWIGQKVPSSLLIAQMCTNWQFLVFLVSKKPHFSFIIWGFLFHLRSSHLKIVNLLLQKFRSDYLDEKSKILSYADWGFFFLVKIMLTELNWSDRHSFPLHILGDRLYAPKIIHSITPLAYQRFFLWNSWTTCRYIHPIVWDSFLSA